MEDDRVFDCNLTVVESSSNPEQSITPHQGLERVKMAFAGHWCAIGEVAEL